MNESFFEELEVKLDALADDKAMQSDEGLVLLEQYKDALIAYLFEVNGKSADDTQIEQLDYKPLNAAERIDFISANSFHFMRYQQMKTMRPEIKKLAAIKKLRDNRKAKKESIG